MCNTKNVRKLLVLLEPMVPAIDKDTMFYNHKPANSLRTQDLIIKKTLT